MAARSVGVRFTNKTPFFLVNTSAQVLHGIWSDNMKPPIYIIPYGDVAWQSESDGVMTGTQGNVEYIILEPGISSDPSQSTKWSVTWDNPYSGSNSCGSAVYGMNASGYAINNPDDASIGGNQAIMRWTLYQSD